MNDLRTICARSARHAPAVGRPLAPVIVPSSTFGFDTLADVDRYYDAGDGYLYSRYGNPSVERVENLLAELEGAEGAVCFSSGMGAITTALSAVTRAGDRVVAQRELYGGTSEYLRGVLPLGGVKVDWITTDELARLEPARLVGARALYLESPTNPTLRIVDLERVATIAREVAVVTLVDATFATPALERPIERGIDLVVHSATKYLGGHGDLIGGVVAGRGESIGAIRERRRITGATMDPFSAFLLHRGLRTLAVRVEAHCRGAARVAAHLERAAGVERVIYPGLASHPDHELARRRMPGYGGMVSFVISGGAPAAERVHDALTLFAKAGSLGSIESLVSIPARMSHRHLGAEARLEAGIPDGLLRLSVGLESPEDLIADLDRALAAAG
ncbi:MAG TPA: aminotransferase class I/II-fold pyridoxal phosphate-dependent enzyme [Candidatus Polarisedimenticolaceae bacterium]|nr:aminotransferase class I/II-fold pyridoxal phosphate-dependent enzyme [Candidatus Polarisedimenticolaceae bacterium]